MATPEACNQIVDNLFKILVDGYKHDYIGEKISQLDHCLQAAAQAVDAGTNYYYYNSHHLIIIHFNSD